MTPDPPPVERIVSAFRTRLESVGLEKPEKRVLRALCLHFQELYRWNRRVNLTSVRGWERGLDKHLVESWSGARFLLTQELPQGTVVDLGSGNGYPGIPVLAAMDGRSGLLVEARARKADFLRSILRRTGLAERVDVLEQRLGGAGELPAPPSLVTFRALPDPEGWVRELRSRWPAARIAAWLAEDDAERISAELKREGSSCCLHVLPGRAGAVLLTEPRR